MLGIRTVVFLLGREMLEKMRIEMKNKNVVFFFKFELWGVILIFIYKRREIGVLK